MRRRILISTLLTVALTALFLGGPLALATWQLVEDFTRAELTQRLEQVTETVEEYGTGPQSQELVEAAIPPNSRLVVVPPDSAPIVYGVDRVDDPVTESLPFGPGGIMELSQPTSVMRSQQTQVVAVVVLLVGFSVTVGTGVAVYTARRLSDPLRDLAARAARLGAGDFRRSPARYDIAELDRVSEVLDSSATALSQLLHRERSLVGDVSHQLRSRITALQLRLDELACHPDPDARREAKAALEQTERLTAVLDDLLESARAARAVGAEPVDLAEAVADAEREWRGPLTAAGRSLRVRVPEGLLARVTAARLREAIGVLVDNALQHGEGTVTIAAREGENALLVEVSDTGPGVPEDLVPHVFDRGISAQSSTGLGLALARTLVEADGGRLELSRARPPVFRLYLPAARTDDVAAAAPVPDRTGPVRGAAPAPPGRAGLTPHELVRPHEPAEGPPAEGHPDQGADDLPGHEVCGLLGDQRDERHLQLEDVARDPQRCRVHRDPDPADHEEQEGLVVPLPPAAGPEGPLAVQHVGHHRRHQHRDHLGGHRLVGQHRGLQHQEHHRVDDPGAAADHQELDQFTVFDRLVAVRLGILASVASTTVTGSIVPD